MFAQKFENTAYLKKGCGLVCPPWSVSAAPSHEPIHSRSAAKTQEWVIHRIFYEIAQIAEN
jgi:hypothetical protein